LKWLLIIVSLLIMTEILHLNYDPVEAAWIISILTRLRSSVSVTLKERLSKWKEIGLTEIGMAFTTRLELRYRAAFKFSKLLQKLRDEINDSGKLDELLNGGYVYDPEDHRILYDICVAIDALYFESRSAYEIFGRFVRTFAEKILNCKFTEKKIQQVLIDSGQETDWIEEVREHRKLFFHETAPWIALSILKRQPLKLSLIVMKVNLRNLDDPSKYITQQQLIDSWNAFERAISIICDWLKEQIDVFEKKEIS